MALSEDNLWSIEQTSIRDATLHETSSGFLVDAEEYQAEKDGIITGSRNAVLLDLDL